MTMARVVTIQWDRTEERLILLALDLIPVNKCLLFTLEVVVHLITY
jgi:hypothetical protein